MITTAASGGKAFTLVECLVVVVLLLILVAVLLPIFTQSFTTPCHVSQMSQGSQMYKAIFAKVLVDPDAARTEFPATTNGFTTSTQYLRHLVTNGTVNVDFSFFSGCGLHRYKSTDPAQFKSDGNAWSVILDVAEEFASQPLLISRNLLPTATHLPPATAKLNQAMLGETGKGKILDFNRECAVIVTKAGTSWILRKKNFEANQPVGERLNPSGAMLPILRP